MIPIAIGIAVLFLIFFFWSVDNGDFRDTERIKYTMIFDDDDDVAHDLDRKKQSQPRGKG